MKWGRRATSAVAAAVVLVVGLSAWGIAAIPGSDGVIRACVDERGEVRLIDPESPRRSARACRGSEQGVEWNQAGRRGERGPAGDPGPAGRTVCKDEDLLLCLPDRPDLRPRLVLDGTTILDGESYRASLEHELISYASGGDPGPPKRLVKSTTTTVVMVGDLVGSPRILEWFELARSGSPAARRDARLELHDAHAVVWTAMLRNALPRSVRIDDGRVQVALDVEGLVPTTP